MPDIRYSPELDDFTRAAPENPALPPWINTVAAFDMEIDSGHLGGTEFPTSPCRAYYQDLIFSGSRDREVWGRANGDPPNGAAWRLGMQTAGGDGYEVLVTNFTGFQGWIYRTLAGGSVDINIADENGLIHIDDDFVMMRHVGGTVECWHGSSDGETWTQIFSQGGARSDVVYPALGATDVTVSWDSFGAGKRSPRTQIYRILRGTN